MDEILAKYSLSQYAARYIFVHIRTGGLEVEFYPSIVKTFQNPRTLDLIYQISSYAMPDEYYFPYPSRPATGLGIHLLHLASMYGVSVLCREILRQSNMIERMYHLFELIL
jgi:hypothetical protein